MIARHSAQRVGTEGYAAWYWRRRGRPSARGYADAQTTSQLLGTGAQYGVLLPFSRSQELEAIGSA